MKPISKKSKENEWKTALQKYAKNTGVRRVRIHIANRELKKLIQIKDKKTKKVYKYMDNAESYCIDIYKPSNSDKWQFEVINMFAAHKNEMPQWRKNDPHAKLVMRLFKRDTIAYEDGDKYSIKRIITIFSDGSIGTLDIAEVKNKESEEKFFKPSTLQKLSARKIYIDEIGRIFDPKKNS